MPVFINNQNLLNLNQKLSEDGINSGNETIDAICGGILILMVLISFIGCFYLSALLIIDTIKEHHNNRRSK